MAKKKIIFFLFAIFSAFFAYSNNGYAATVLEPGDIFIITANSTNPDVIEFVSRVDITTGTVIYFSDDAITSTGGWRGEEGYISFTTLSLIERGTIIRLSDLETSSPFLPIISPSGIGSVTKYPISGVIFGLAVAGDNIFVYQDSSYQTNNANFLHVIGFGPGRQRLTGGVAGSQSSYLPSPLQLGTTAHTVVAGTASRNVQYNCINTDLSDIDAFMTSISNQSNWNTSSSPFGHSPCNFITSDAPLLGISLASGQSDFTSGTLVKYQIESTEPLNINSFTCDDVILDGTYEEAECISIDEISPFDGTLFEVSIQVTLDTDGYGDIELTLATGGIMSISGAYDEGYMIDNNYIVIDALAPIITLNGSGIMTLDIGSPWTDPGATCIDNIDSSCTVLINGIFDTNTPGTYIITYTATDEVGNSSNTTRTIQVIDINAPIVTLNGSGSITIEAGSSWSDPGATCIDNIDSSCTVTFTGNVNTSTVGTYTITYTATDSDDNTNTMTRTIYVVDTTPPTITLLGDQSISLNLNDTWVDPGAVWSDIVDGSGTILSPMSGSVNTSAPGTYILSYYYIDAHNNQSNIVTRTINIITNNTGGTSNNTENNNRNNGGGYTLPHNNNISEVDKNIFNHSIQNICFTPSYIKTIEQGNTISEKFKIAHQMLYSYQLTKWQGTADYRPYDYLTREEAARFMVEFAQNVLCRKATRQYNNNFSDLDTANPSLKKSIRESYTYAIFNGHSDGTFKPTDRISNDELATIMVRLATNSMLPEPEGDRAGEYKKTLEQYAKISKLNNKGRGNIAEVIYDLYRNNTYTLQDIGYVIQ